MATLNELKMLFSNRSASDVAIEISGFTGFRTTLLEELTPEEMNELYNIHCKAKIPQISTESEAIYQHMLKKHWIGNVLTIATEEGIKEPNDWKKFNDWMMRSSKFKKHLNAHSVKELKILHQQLCKLRDNNERSSQKPLTKAWMKKAIKNQNLN